MLFQATKNDCLGHHRCQSGHSPWGSASNSTVYHGFIIFHMFKMIHVHTHQMWLNVGYIYIYTYIHTYIHTYIYIYIYIPSKFPLNLKNSPFPCPSGNASPRCPSPLTTRRVTLSAAHVLQETARPRVEHVHPRNPKEVIAPVGFLDGEVGEFQL